MLSIIHLASAMGMMNLKNLDWDEEALEIAGVTPRQLSELVPTTEIFNNCNPKLQINWASIHKPHLSLGQVMEYFLI